MPEFKRSKEKVEDKNLTKKTIMLGGATFLLFLIIFIFGLPLLIRFSVYLSDRKKNNTNKTIVLPPQPPRIMLPFESTPSATIDIKGFAEKGVNVELSLPDGKKIRKTANDDGEFIFEKIDLQSGPNIFSGIAFFADDTPSEASKNFIVIRDDSPPELEITNPGEEKVTVDVPDYDLVGKTEVKSLVKINTYVASVNDKGEFKLKLQLQPGKNEYTIVSKDPAGNQTTKKVTITYDF